MYSTGFQTGTNNFLTIACRKYFVKKLGKAKVDNIFDTDTEICSYTDLKCKHPVFFYFIFYFTS